MKTLIELYDERAIENILAADVFRPERIVYLCPPEVAMNEAFQRTLAEFFRHRGWRPALDFIPSAFFDTDKVLHQLTHVAEVYPDCALDVTGGTDAALVAAGMLVAGKHVPAFTYSRKQNRFYSIYNADFADNVVCSLRYRVGDFFLMGGGHMRPGRVDNAILAAHTDAIRALFSVFLRYRQDWTGIIAYMQRVSGVQHEGTGPLDVRGGIIVKGDHGSRIHVHKEALSEMERLSLIEGLSIDEESGVAFRFADEHIRTWLRDFGSALELFVYRSCLDADIFCDVVSSAVVDWTSGSGQEIVRNEIDCVAVRGVVPLFISCKACDIHTEALNELAILRDRFGGKGAKAAIVTSERCGSAARHRAAQLSIAVIDLDELETGDITARLRTIMKAN